MDATFWIILVILVIGTVLALIQARRRDKCLRDFDGFHVTLAEKDGDLSWGAVRIFPSGLEVTYTEPVVARRGHLERSFIFYKEQYAAMDALFRYPEGLSDAAQERRREVIERTANPSLWRRLRRHVRNWISMVRDALLQVSGVVIGAAKTRTPGAAVLSGQEQNLKALSSEIIGHAGNAFDPLLEQHLFRQVVVELTRDGRTFSYCGWLKDYTTEFIEILDAVASTGDAVASRPLRPGEAEVPGIDVRIEEGRVRVTNGQDRMLFVGDVEADGWARTLGVVVPVGFTADLTLPPDVDPGGVRVHVGTARRVDMVVPRTHALVRHAADGSEARFQEEGQSVVAEVTEAHDAAGEDAGRREQAA